MKLAFHMMLVSGLALPAVADTGIGLAGDRTLVRMDIAAGKVTAMTEIAHDGRILGIDYRPATDALIGVTDRFEVVSIDPETGAVTPIVAMDMDMEIADGAAVIVEINPAADALRFMSGTTNHRVNLTTGAVTVDGELTFADGTYGPPSVGGTAYSNSFGMPEATSMYNIDTALSALLRQFAPNDGENELIGTLGGTISVPVAFDIVTNAGGLNTAWLVSDGLFHRVSLEDGSIDVQMMIEGLDVTLRDVTVIAARD